jgi:cobalt-precorrin 5A hydrolase/precorrin-3B C17-methyltransferase
MAVTPVVLALSTSGELTAHRVAKALEVPVHGREGRVEVADVFFPNALDHARDLFAAGTPVIGVCASGILIRAVAPLLSDKRAEPPVVAISDDGSVVVPLLGGHRGANRLAAQISKAIGAKAAVTTAGDVAMGVALDAPPRGYMLANIDDAKSVMSALLAGGGASVTGEPLFELPEGDAVEICVTEAPIDGCASRLVYHPQRYALGVGCARGADPGTMIEQVKTMLGEAGVAPGAIACVGTLDLKADEPAVNALARHLDVPLRVFSAVELDVLTPRLETPSDVVFAEVGCHGVAEAAALALAGASAKLTVAKIKTATTTCALARNPDPIAELAGRSRGRLSVVGIGPGQSGWRTPEASRLIAEADELVGYGLYIDLLGPVAAGKPRHDFPLGGEEERCRFALERAGEGRNVALICSGDAGIYAMGALVFELLDRPGSGHGVSDAGRRAEVICTPGVSALQAAAARAGAPLGHDFCAISLSDLLTPRADILRRLQAAAVSDFVIAFYNPVSKRRRTLLGEARDILLHHRPADTPVLLASSLGRPEEFLRYRRLADLDVDEVDMLTVVLVGSSHSRLADLGEGPRMYTPRGYARKIDGDLAEPSRHAEG